MIETITATKLQTSADIANLVEDSILLVSVLFYLENYSFVVLFLIVV